MTNKRLTLSLPEDVWNRLDAEAKDKGMTIGTHVQHLIVARDDRRTKKDPR